MDDGCKLQFLDKSYKISIIQPQAKDFGSHHFFVLNTYM